jgi:tetratricopeptide (TPR) repeat protein
MKLGATLFRTNCKMFEVVESEDTGDYLEWNLVPLAGQTLAREHMLSGLADGYFVLEGLLVHADGRIEQAYTDVSLPERNIDSHFLLRNKEVVRGRGTFVPNAQVIPAVAIEKVGVYDQYYVKGRAEIGLKVLQDGLAVAKLKWPIALDVAYILRDEKRYSEAVEAFTLAISECDSINYFYYSERAKLFTKLNNQKAANRDWEQVEHMAGAHVLKYERGF